KTMKKNIKITVANPAGNKTIFVHDKFERAEYAKVAEQLLGMEEFAAEQVAFILDAPECGRAEGKMEMCGLEFCGNATRTFGLMVARQLGISGSGKVFVDVSGVDEILTVEVNTNMNYTKVKMPAYIDIKRFDISGIFDTAGGSESAGATGGAPGAAAAAAALKEVKAVDFGGILHLIIPDIPANLENFERVKKFVYDRYNPPAMGAMFYDTKNETLAPVVYVKDVDSTYFEGSCASGTASCAIAFGSEKPDGDYTFTFPQPAGTIDASVEVRGGKVQTAYIEGPVEIAEPVEIMIEI
ncbi:MAG: hypothetical protein MR440_05195, partial [Firmicutes bacterium]|nr:hypothetical protein [Bacillota bacterium]